MFRTLAIAHAPRRSVVAVRHLHASPAALESLTEKAKKTVKDVNLKVGQTLASGIEKGQETTEAAKDTIGTKSEETKEKAEQFSTEASQKANQASAGVKEATQDAKHDIKKNVK